MAPSRCARTARAAPARCSGGGGERRCCAAAPAAAAAAAGRRAALGKAAVAAAAAAAGGLGRPPVARADEDAPVEAVPVEEALAEELGADGKPLTDEDLKLIAYNERIHQLNGAPEDFPTFVRVGYDVRVLTRSDYSTTPEGLIVKDYVVGDGRQPGTDNEVTFNYIAYNENGRLIDSTYRSGSPAATRMGLPNGMIPGFELGLAGMAVGGKRRIIVPPELGPPTGPATFFSAKQYEVFDIELLKVRTCARKGSGFGSNVVCTD